MTEQTAKPKRKTRTSTEVKQRYNKKTYDRIILSLRKEDDSDIIALIESEKAKGYSNSAAIKNLIRGHE